MRPAVLRFLTLVFVIAAAGAGGAALRQAQPAPAEPNILPALLVEVRGLRAAMEQMVSSGARVQLALGRVQLQEQRIGNQIRRLDAVRASLAPAQKELEALSERVKAIAEGMNEPGVDAETRRGREGEYKEVKTVLGRLNADVQRLSAEEAMLMQDIATEQNRWTEFNQRLEELERALTPRSSPR
jgi:predicted nuclease with TOPRIM domain